MKQGCVPLTVNLKVVGDSGKKMSVIKWDFGDGGTNSHPSSDSFLTHIYTTASKDTTKDYKPKATITFSDGTTCTATYDSVILVWDGDLNGKINLLSNQAQCIYGNKFCFSDSLKFDHTKYRVAYVHWDFGDGTFDSRPSVCHTYNSFGKYTVKLRVSDQHGCGSGDNKTVFALDDSILVLSITKTTSTGYKMTTDTSGWHITKFVWNFGDSTAMDSIDWSPSHNYHHNGRYPVTLSVWTKEGCVLSASDTFNMLMTDISPEIASSISFSVYPNPSSGSFTIDYSLNEKTNIKMLLFDMTGRQISVLMNQNKSAGNYSYYSSNLQMLRGTYIIKIYKDNIPAGEKLIVVQP